MKEMMVLYLALMTVMMVQDMDVMKAMKYDLFKYYVSQNL